MKSNIAAAALALIIFTGAVPGSVYPGAVMASAAQVMSVSGAVYPSGSLIVGKSFSVSGDVSSEKGLSGVSGGVYTAMGEPVQGMVFDYPASGYSFSIGNTFDKDLPFKILVPGDYVFRITARDISGYEEAVIDSPFTVTAEGALPSAMGVTQLSLPFDQMLSGSSFAARGLISSTFIIDKVWGGVYSPEGVPVEGAYTEVSPRSNSFELLTGFGSALSFGQLPEGSYTYRVQAQDILGFTETVAEKEFTVTDAPASDITAYSASYPTGEHIQGAGFGVSGTVSSVYPLEKVWGGVYYADGTATEQYTEASPGTSSYSLSAFDAVLGFGKLPVGEYVYRISAEDSRGFSRVVTESRFSVRSYEPAEHEKVLGVDVSAHQQNVDWASVKASGVDFVVLRAVVNGYSSPYPVTDDTFDDYYYGAKAAGLDVGAYIFTSAFNKSEMKENISYLLDVLGGRELDLPLYIDVEVDDRQIPLGKKALTDMVCYGCELIEEAGYDAGVYSSRTWYSKYLDSDKFRDAGYELWYALWPNDPDSITMFDFCRTWQFSADGSIPGIPGDVDLNYRFVYSSSPHSITAVQSPGGTVSADRSEALPGEKVTVTAVPGTGNKVAAVKYGDSYAAKENGVFTFIMPDRDVTVSAVFMADPKYGDANCDGKVDLADAVAILQYSALPNKYPLMMPELADVDGVPGVTGADALVLEKVDAGLVAQEELPLGNK